VLSGVVIAQLMNRGTPLLVYNGGGQFDMRSMTAVLGTPEMATVMMAGNQLARFYKIPTHACIPCSDSHCPDQQLGMENMMFFFAGMLCKSDLMVNAGMFATGETASFEQLIIDNEIIKLARSIAKGILVNEDTVCSAGKFRF
jgi:trimethylamine--corrinoid protein Co-methyltransferase